MILVHKKGSIKRTAVIILFFVIELAIGISYFSESLGLVVAALMPAVISSAYLQIVLKKIGKNSKYDKEKLQMPTFFFGVIFIPLIISIIVLIFYYSAPLTYLSVYSAIILLVMTLTFMITIFFVPLAIYRTRSSYPKV